MAGKRRFKRETAWLDKDAANILSLQALLCAKPGSKRPLVT